MPVCSDSAVPAHLLQSRDDRLRAERTAPLRRDRREELVDGGGERQPYPELLGGGAGQTEILLLQFDHEPGGEVRRCIRGAKFVSIHDAAAPPPTARKTAAGSSPALVARTTPSATAASVAAPTTWFTSFVICPCPGPPM